MASPCDNRLTVNIKNLPIITDINNGDFLIVEAPDGTSILDFRNFLITLDNTTFSSTFLNYNTRIIELSSSFNQLSGTLNSNTSSITGLELSVGNISSDLAAVSSIVNSDITALPGSANIRISLDSTTSTPTNTVSGSTLYVHSYKGNTISLYDTTLKMWVRYPYPTTGVITQTLADSSNNPLRENTNFDIFLQYVDSEYVITFDPWNTSTAGAVEGYKNRTYIDNVCVHKDNFSKRLIGCIRTTTAGVSEQSFGGRAIGGVGCKQLVWNAQNQLPVSCWSFESGSYNAVIPSVAPYWTGWRKVNPTASGGTNHRFTFLTGDLNSINLIGQIYSSYYSDVDAPVSYVGIAVDTEENAPSIDEGQLISELRGSDVTPRAQLMKTFRAGLHTIQLLENIGGPAGISVLMNESHTNQTGYIVTLSM